MSPSADPASTSVATESLVPEGVLQEGEIVILAMKPSPWFVLLISLPILTIVGVAAAVVFFAGELLFQTDGVNMIFAICLAALCARLVVASFQWMGRLYILTNRRVMRLRGLVHVDISQCPLKNINQTMPIAGRAEGYLGLGSLFFEMQEGKICEVNWVNISQPEQVNNIATDAIQKAKLQH